MPERPIELLKFADNHGQPDSSLESCTWKRDWLRGSPLGEPSHFAACSIERIVGKWGSGRENPSSRLRWWQRAAAPRGKSNRGKLTTAIIGGEPTLPGDFPATGALLYKGVFRCTATLIAPDVIVTAAHCLPGNGEFSFTLVSQVPLTPSGVIAPVNGDADAGTDSGDDVAMPIPFTGPTYPVLLVHAHPEWDSGGAFKDLGQVNDVGIAILRRPITTVPVEQVDTRLTDVGPGSELHLTGYGVTAWYLRYSAGVKHDAMVLVDGVGDFEIRTSAAAVEAQPCKGDSGGPLFAQNSDGSHPITAVVSRSATASFQCNEGSIATRIAPYASWIAEASLDRETGCSVGGGEKSWAAALVWLLVAFSRRRTHRTK